MRTVGTEPSEETDNREASMRRSTDTQAVLDGGSPAEPALGDQRDLPPWLMDYPVVGVLIVVMLPAVVDSC